jgi:hypothetical protein
LVFEPFDRFVQDFIDERIHAIGNTSEPGHRLGYSTVFKVLLAGHEHAEDVVHPPTHLVGVLLAQQLGQVFVVFLSHQSGVLSITPCFRNSLRISSLFLIASPN